MDDEFREHIYNELNLRETEDLLEIWQANDHAEWTDTAFDVIKKILTQRLGEIPSQESSLPEQDEIIDKGKETVASNASSNKLEDWEEKLLNDENQPELYSTLEVLNLRDKINKAATGVIVVYVLLGLLNFQFVRDFLQGIPMSLPEILGSLPNEIFTILSIGLQITLTYFPLKALAQILRILMEMEYRSRKRI